MKYDKHEDLLVCIHTHKYIHIHNHTHCTHMCTTPTPTPTFTCPPRKYKEFLDGITPPEWFEAQASKLQRRKDAMIAEWQVRACISSA